MENAELYHYGRKGMKWYQNIFTKGKKGSSRKRGEADDSEDSNRSPTVKPKSSREMTAEELDDLCNYVLSLGTEPIEIEIVPTQIDLDGKPSGLMHALKILKDIDQIAIHRFEKKDIVRHALVQKIVDAYERKSNEGNRNNGKQRP